MAVVTVALVVVVALVVAAGTGYKDRAEYVRATGEVASAGPAEEQGFEPSAAAFTFEPSVGRHGAEGNGPDRELLGAVRKDPLPGGLAQAIEVAHASGRSGGGFHDPLDGSFTFLLTHPADESAIRRAVRTGLKSRVRFELVAHQVSSLQEAATVAREVLGHDLGGIGAVSVNVRQNRVDIDAATTLSVTDFETRASEAFGVEVALVGGRQMVAEMGSGETSRDAVEMIGRFRQGDTNNCFETNRMTTAMKYLRAPGSPRPWVCKPDGQTSWLVRDTTDFDLGPWTLRAQSDITGAVKVTGIIVDNTELVLTSTHVFQCTIPTLEALAKCE